MEHENSQRLTEALQAGPAVTSPLPNPDAVGIKSKDGKRSVKLTGPFSQGTHSNVGGGLAHLLVCRHGASIPLHASCMHERACAGM